MKILVFCGDPGVPIHGPSGASAHLRGISRGLVARGHRVVLAALHHSDGRGRHDVPLGLSSITSGRLPWPSGLRTFGEGMDGRRLARRFRRASFDLVYERYSFLCDGGLRLARAHGVPHILEVNAPLSIERSRRHPLEGRLLRGTDRVVAVSPWLGEWCQQQGAREVVVVPNGSDLQPIPTPPRPPGRLRLVHHGSLRPWHGVDFLPTLLDALPEAELWVIGDGLVKHPRAQGWSSLDPGPLADRLSRCDVGLLPYPRTAPPWYDPLKLHDYRALGIPTVGSLHPSVREADARMDVSDVAGWARAILDVVDKGRPSKRPWTRVAGEALGPWER